ncbi:mannan-binding lectin [Desulfovibrio sp. OttesenSCG-928-C06]|nr:mannan-binding lectin [Desulfovibrio sp. OttesenSCG-928-C06]
MKNIFRAFLACCLLLLTASPALAELEVKFINRTGFEIQAINIKGDGGGMGFTIRVVPDNFCIFADGNSSQLQEVTIDVGLMLLTFTDMSALEGNSKPILELSYGEDGLPRLTLVDNPDAPDSGSVQKGESFDLPAGPIWSNDHAAKRCPEVLEKWLAENPGSQAEWNGNWLTTEPGEMSVCGITLLEGGTAPSSASGASFAGTETVLADPADPTNTSFSAVLAAENLGEIRAMGAQDFPLWSSQVYLPASFAGKTWAVLVESQESFSRNDADKPGACSLRTYTIGIDDLTQFLQTLAQIGYRPWFFQLSTGEDMETEHMTQIWKEDLSREKAWNEVADVCMTVNQNNDPAAVDIVLLNSNGYDLAEEGQNPELPGFRMRVSNANVIVLQYLPDVSELISMTRD